MATDFYSEANDKLMISGQLRQVLWISCLLFIKR